MLRRNFLKLGAVLPFFGLTSLAKSDTITENTVCRIFPIDDQYYWKVSGPSRYVYKVEQNQLSKSLSYHIDNVGFVHIRQNTLSKDVYLHLAMCSQPPKSKKDYLLGWYFYQENQLSDINDKITVTLSKLA